MRKISPYWSIRNEFNSHLSGELYLGHVVDVLTRLPDRMVQCAVTSPPYWGLRDYGVCECATWLSAYDSPTSTLNGGGNVDVKQKDPDPNCKICKGTGRTIDKSIQIGVESSPDCSTHGQAQCGDCFVCSMVRVARELYRVLRDDGVFWLNLGDSYSPGGDCPVPAGNLIGVPWRVALALQHDGWILRSDVIWAKPNSMRESVENRCTKSHEHIFQFTKSTEYYYDKDAIAEEATPGTYVTTERSGSARQALGAGKINTGGNGIPGKVWSTGDTRNKNDVWFVATRAYDGAHFATFSSELITPCILSSTSEHGCCAVCNKPWERVVVKSGGEVKIDGEVRDRSMSRNRHGLEGSTLDGVIPKRETVGWQKICACGTNEVVPCVVLDPFVGSGTTVATSIELYRSGIGIDVSEHYLKEHAIPRVEASITGRPIKKDTTPLAQGTRLPVQKFR